MKQIKSKWFAVLTAGLLCLGIGTAIPVSAETKGETAENNTIATAEEIAVNMPVTGALSSNDDIDYYAFTLEEDGAFSIHFEHAELSSSSNYWRISLVDAESNTLRYWDIAGTQAISKTDMQGFHAGTYYIKISSLFYNASDYQLQINYTAASASEQLYEFEYNDTSADANPLPLNTSCIGNLHNNSDIDYYAVELEKDGLFSISYTHPEFNSNTSYWRLTLMDPEGNSLHSWDITGNQSSYTTDVQGLHAGTYYVKVSSIFYNDASYDLQINYQAASDSKQLYEAEFNNTLADANTLPLNTSCIGNLYSDTDVDYYAISLEESGSFSVSFSHPERTSSSSYWKMTLLDTQGNAMQAWSIAGDKPTTETDLMGFRAGIYYLKIESVFYEESSYTLEVNYTSAKEAEQLYEAEYNDTMQTANTIPIATSCIGSLCNDKDVDYYCFSIDESAQVKVTFSHPELNDNTNHWNIALTDASGTVLDEWKSTGSEAMKTWELEPSFEAGTYYLKVTSAFHRTDSYSIQVDTSAIPYFKGDVNADGFVDTFDAYDVLLSYAKVSAGLENGKLEGNAFLAADVNEDEKIDTFDAYYILLYYATCSAGYTTNWDEILK